MTLTQLEYIIAVDTYRHFATAAKKCFITQPTLSMQIHKLEDELGIKIFDRSKQPVVPTEIGVMVINRAREVLQNAEMIREIIEDQKDGLSGELRLGIIPTLAPYILPRFISSFMTKYPQVKLIVEELQTQEIINKLKNETIDTGLLVTPLRENGILEMPIFYEAFVAYVSADHPLYKKKHVTTAELKPDKMWLLNQGHCFRNQMINLCGEREEMDKRLNFEFESGSLETLKRLVEKENGFTLLPELAVEDMTPSQKKRIRVFSPPTPVREVSLVIRRSFLKRKLIEALRSEIRDNVPAHTQSMGEGTVVNWR